MISYELAKQLKEAGFPFREAPYSTSQAKIRSMNDGMGNLIIFDGLDVVFYEATLSELIEACGESFRLDASWSGNPSWSAMVGLGKKMKFYGKGPTPEEAVASLWLWLALNKKDA